MLRFGKAIPENTAHVSIPTWQNTIEYEEGKVKLNTGYPRFVFDIHVVKLVELCREKFGLQHEDALIFPSATAAKECQSFLQRHFNTKSRLIEQILIIPPHMASSLSMPKPDRLILFILIFPFHAKSQAKQFWQHTGEIASSRFAKFCLQLWQEPSLLMNFTVRVNEGGFKNDYYSSSAKFHPDHQLESCSRQYQLANALENETFVEERFGRNLHMKMGDAAKLALKSRISNAFSDKEITVKEGDVYLYPCGMNAIYHAHKLCIQAIPDCKTVQFGFPYIDTLKIQEKFGSGCVFLGVGDSSDMQQLHSMLENGMKIAAVFSEFPSNPLLKSPDLEQLSRLARNYKFLLIIDDTIGNMVNTRVLHCADIVVTSLTKIFSGDSNVMGGSLVLNPQSSFYSQLVTFLGGQSDTFWFEDAIFLERNSRTFRERILAINRSAETLCDHLISHPKVSKIFYPKFTDAQVYKKYQTQEQSSGYGGLFSLVLHNEEATIKFFDRLRVLKGPSLGTNFTLCCAYTLLAHYNELDWAAKFGVPRHLVRVSVGLEDINWLLQVFNEALEIE